LVQKVQEQLDKYKNIIIYDKIEQDPRLSAVTEGVNFVRENGISNIIAIGGGSVLDAAKCLASVSNNEGNPEDYWLRAGCLLILNYL
jgi:alcohol dehydrogenase class IV